MISPRIRSRSGRLNVSATIPLARRLVQLGYLLFCLFAGFQFYRFFLWAVGRSDTYVVRPPSVEGFLPISALMGLKRLVLTGAWDMVHPAGLTIFLAALATGVLLRKGFCGWICPVGCVSNLVESLGRRFHWLRRLPGWVDIPLLSLKYLLLGFFGYLIVVRMPVDAIEGFMKSPYNLAADAKMLDFFLHPSMTTVWVMGFLLLISFVVANFWCRYLCPYGALLGLIAMAGPMRIRRNPSNCIDCGRCDRICPGALRVSGKQRVVNPECIGCLECVAVCPAHDCLSLGLWHRPLPSLLLPLALIGLMLSFWLVALGTGHWHSSLPLATMQKLYRMSTTLAHPPI